MLLLAESLQGTNRVFDDVALGIFRAVPERCLRELLPFGVGIHQHFDNAVLCVRQRTDRDSPDDHLVIGATQNKRRIIRGLGRRRGGLAVWRRADQIGGFGRGAAASWPLRPLVSVHFRGIGRTGAPSSSILHVWAKVHRG